LNHNNKTLELRIIVDNGALEIFSPDGSFVMTGLFTKKEGRPILETFSKGGNVEISEMKIYHLKSIWANASNGK
jgi:sucrose-6-phosphate hydrolase SacC (GH32 family)